MQTLKNGPTILVGEDELEVSAYLEMALKCLGYSVELAQDGDEVLSCLHASRPEIAAVLLDIMMPNRDGLDTLREIRAIDPHLPVIIVSGTSSPVTAVAVMKSGATDFLCKPVGHEELRKSLNWALQTRSAAADPAPRKTHAAPRAFTSSNQRMHEIQAFAAQIAWSEVPVLIQGETGSGKEVLARELHAQSRRANKPFLKLNCAALPSELVESELFGYERGAFTGAVQKKAGMFETVDGGTILLDEIGDMDVRLQAKLLQVLQDQEFQRIGGKETIKVDVRVMAATHRDLEQSIANNTFREDLYYRLNVINLCLPPLRDRKEDLLPLAEFLMQKHTVRGVPAPAITADLETAMKNYDWPGNVRELENTVRRLLILRDPDGLARELRSRSVRKAQAPVAAPAPAPAAVAMEEPLPDRPPVLEQVAKAKHRAEAEAIIAALNSTRWNRKQAAAILRIDYKALLYKMKKLGVEGQPTSALMGVSGD